MRLPGTKIWRAFPELDSFDDKRAAQFVRAACKAFWLVKLVRAGAMFLGGMACCLVMAIAGGTVMNTMDRLIKEPMLTLLVGLTAVVVGVISMSLLMIVRDFFMRRRVRKVIASRGSCVKCGYVLIGLRVPEDLNLRCPECGSLTVLNLDLDETALDAEGKHRRFLGRHQGALPVRFWTPVRRRFVTTAAVISVVVPIVLGLGWWGVRAYRDVRDAGRAMALLTGTYSFQQYYDGLLDESERREGEPRAFALLNSLCARINIVENDVYNQVNAETNGQSSVWPQYDNIWDPRNYQLDANLTADDREYQLSRITRSAEAARLVLQRFRETDQDGHLARELIKARNLKQVITNEEYNPFTRNCLPASRARMVCEFALGMMNEAAKAHDRERFFLWLGVANRCVELCGRIPCVSAWLSLTVCMDRINSYFLITGAKDVPREWLDDIARELKTNSPRTVTSRQMFEGETIWVGSAVSLYFSNPKSAESLASGRWMLTSNRDTRIGSLDENLEYLKYFESWYEQHLTNGRWDTSKPFIALRPTDLELFQLFAGFRTFNRFTVWHEWSHYQRDVVLLVLAIERYRRDEGRLPQSLETLTPEYTERVPREFSVDRPISYRPTPAQSGESQPTTYLLYLWGDAQDDRGAADLAKQTPGPDGLILVPAGSDYRLYPLFDQPQSAPSPVSP